MAFITSATGTGYPLGRMPISSIDAASFAPALRSGTREKPPAGAKRIREVAHDAFQSAQDARIQQLERQNEALIKAVEDLTRTAKEKDRELVAALAAQLDLSEAFKAAIAALKATVVDLNAKHDALRADHDRMFFSQMNQNHY